MKESKLKILLDGIVRIIKAIKCRFICCKSSCNTDPEIKGQKNI